MDRPEDGREPEPSRILIADDHPLLRTALRQMLSAQPDLEVVGEAANGLEAVELCRRLHPQLILMDVRMPEMDGFEATRRIKRQSPSTIVLMLSAFENTDYLLEALKVGASGYVLKDENAQQIAEAVRRVLEGESPINHEMGMLLLRRLIEERRTHGRLVTTPGSPAEGTSEERPRPALDERLSPREVQVLRCLVRGETNQQIARELYISVSTVKNHVYRIMRKLGASDRVQAAVVAIELGLLTDSFD